MIKSPTPSPFESRPSAPAIASPFAPATSPSFSRVDAGPSAGRRGSVSAYCCRAGAPVGSSSDRAHIRYPAVHAKATTAAAASHRPWKGVADGGEVPPAGSSPSRACRSIRPRRPSIRSSDARARGNARTASIVARSSASSRRASASFSMKASTSAWSSGVSSPSR